MREHSRERRYGRISRRVGKFRRARSGRKRRGIDRATADAEPSRRGVSPVDPDQLAGLRAVTIHAAPSIITDRSPGQPAKAARTAAEARARMSSG